MSDYIPQLWLVIHALISVKMLVKQTAGWYLNIYAVLQE